MNKELQDDTTKEFRLRTLLGPYEGAMFYYIIAGRDFKISELKTCSIYLEDPLHPFEDDVVLSSEGKQYHAGICVLYPTRALYEKYPLDPEKAWREWEESDNKCIKYEMFS